VRDLESISNHAIIGKRKIAVKERKTGRQARKDYLEDNTASGRIRMKMNLIPRH